MKLSVAAELALLNYDWPGNIRELENAVHRALLACSGNRLRPEDFKLPGIKVTGQKPSISISSLEASLQNLFERGAPHD